MTRPTPRLRRRKAGIAVLPVLAALLFASAGLRTVEGDNVARIRAFLETGPAYAADGGQTPTDEIGEVLSALREREAQLEEREKSLDAREEVVREGEVELSRQMSEIEAAEGRLREMVNLADKASEQDVQTLVAVYENMRPDEAAPLFEQMPPAFAAGFLASMQPVTAAAVLAAMPPDAAYAVSVVLAGRNADLMPTNDQ